MVAVLVVLHVDIKYLKGIIYKKELSIILLISILVFNAY
jgi:hypothetical protein